MVLPWPALFQLGLPEWLPGLLVLAGTIVLGLMLLAMGAFVYKQLTGGIEWPEDKEDDDEVRRGDADDEWDFY